MNELPWEDLLQAMERELGFEEVHTLLHRLQELHTPLPLELQPPLLLDVEHQVNYEREVPSSTGRKQRKSKTAATQYVGRMGLSLEKRQLLDEVARKFEEKSFLPTFKDVVHFCQIHCIDVPTSRTRLNAVPRVFKFIASMETEAVRTMLCDSSFSGPSRLEPIADAIQRNGRASR